VHRTTAAAGRLPSVRTPVVEENILGHRGTVSHYRHQNRSLSTGVGGSQRCVSNITWATALSSPARLCRCQRLLRPCVVDPAILLTPAVTDECGKWHTRATDKST
jgi:hypothetical protein